MTLNFKFPICDLDGNELIPDAGKYLANRLCEELKGDVFKLFELAQKLNAGEIITLDSSDTAMLKKIITGNEKLAVLIKARLLAPFEKE